MQAGLIKAGLDALYYSNAHSLMSPLCQGVGVIFMLHRVLPASGEPFQPHRYLEVTPDFLQEAILAARRNGYEIVSIDEARRRLDQPGNDMPFACFTLDDGYRDNFEHAYPVFRKHQAPFTVYVPTAFPDGEGEMWWVALERVIASADRLEVTIGGESLSFDAADTKQKYEAYQGVYWKLRALPEPEQRAVVRELCSRNGIDMKAMCRELIMSWDEIRQLAADPLTTIGAHTVSHFAVAKLDDDTARREMKESADAIERELGQRPAHFCFPYGDETSAGPRDFRIARELGFSTAVTTRKGLLYPEHADHMTALPRLSLNGEYQSPRYLDVLLSGVPLLLFNGLQKVNVG